MSPIDGSAGGRILLLFLRRCERPHVDGRRPLAVLGVDTPVVPRPSPQTPRVVRPRRFASAEARAR